MNLDKCVGTARVAREIFDSMPVMLVGLTGPNHRIDAMNAVYRAAVNRDECVGLPLAEVFPEAMGQQIFPMFDRVYETGTPQIAEGWRVQIEKEAGSGRLEDLHLDFTAAPRLAPDGTVIGINFIGVDASARVAEREAARRVTAEAVRRYERARDVTNALQRRLLPAGLPVLPSVRVGGSYLLADAEDAAGGDWFDAVPLAGGRVALVVGDVVGHGVAAAAAMGQLRALLQDRLDETGDVLAAVAAADRMADRTADARAATVCVAVLDPADGTLTYCTAGHPPPLVAGPARARYLAPTGSGPLGTGAGYTLATDRLDPGEVVLLYTDGIVERPGRTPAAATVELSQVVTDAVAGRGLDPSGRCAPDRACVNTLELLVRQTGHTDDITLLAAQRRTPAEPLRMRLPRDISLIRPARDGFLRWVRDLGIGEDDIGAVAHALVELVTNAVEHSRTGDTGGTVVVTGELSDRGELRVEVTDDGRWQHRDRPDELRHDRGLGLAMSARLVDHLDIDRGASGTTMTVRHRVARPAMVLTAEQISQGLAGTVPAGDEPMTIVDQPGGSVAIQGALDSTNANHLAGELDLITMGGSRELEVDLTGVTHLASAAVAVLHRTAGLRLYAPPGSVAQHVLSLVDLPHRTTR